MKAFLIGVIFLIVLAIAGFFGLQYYGKMQSGSGNQTYKTAAITREGVLQKSTVAGTDYSHVIVSGGKYYGVDSNTVDLDQYVGKNVRATGQNSGDTLYADTVTLIP